MLLGRDLSVFRVFRAGDASCGWGSPRASITFGWNVTSFSVLLGLEPRIHATTEGAAWMLGSSPSMTEGGISLWSKYSDD
ncbi:hypothetical protein ATY75_28220 [Rhizobium sp. N122]|nr:hypothetical protein ATY75_28220 [Rhizobium sp. N122]